MQMQAVLWYLVAPQNHVLVTWVFHMSVVVFWCLFWRSSDNDHYNLFSTSAPPLTVDTVVRAVHGVRNWKKFGENLFSIFDWDKLEKIEQQHRSDGNYLHGVVEEWFKTHRQSWRQIIHALDRENETVLADRIRGYAEPPPGEWSNHKGWGVGARGAVKGFILLHFRLLFCVAFYAADANFRLMHNEGCPRLPQTVLGCSLNVKETITFMPIHG